MESDNFLMRKLLFVALVLVVIAIGLLHFFTPGYLIFYHDTYRRLSYFPIVLGAVWFGVRGGLVLALLSSVAFIPHLLLYFGQETDTYLSELTEIILYIAAGGVTGFIASREAKLREKYQTLSDKLEKSYARLHEETSLLLEVEAQLSASQRLSALGRLSASLAHEIKNPLGSIRGAAEILLDAFPVGHEKREFAEIVCKEAGRLSDTVNEILQYSRGTQSGQPETEKLSNVLERVIRLLDNHRKDKQINITLTGEALAAKLLVDGGKISQVFLNLILNAIDAVPKKGKIGIKVRREKDAIAVDVFDNGPGIPETEKENVFQPFVSGKEDGTGLGLPISRKIIGSYGGWITLRDSEDGGACFTVYLPD